MLTFIAVMVSILVIRAYLIDKEKITKERTAQKIEDMEFHRENLNDYLNDLRPSMIIYPSGGIDLYRFKDNELEPEVLTALNAARETLKECYPPLDSKSEEWEQFHKKAKGLKEQVESINTEICKRLYGKKNVTDTLT